MAFTSLKDLLGRGGRKIGTRQLKLPDSVVTHDSLDKMEFDNYADDSARFRKLAIEDAPQVAGDVPNPTPIDMSSATPEEFIAYQNEMRAAKEARENAPVYSNWDKLTRDVFYSYHTHDQPSIVDPVDPGVELHKRIVPKIMTTDEHAQSRNVTRDDPTRAAIATMAAVRALRDALGDELQEQATEGQEYEDRVGDVQQAIENLEDLREQVREARQQGQPIPQELIDAIKRGVGDKQAAQAAALQAAESQTPIDAAGMAAIEAAAKAGSEAAEAAGCLPVFGNGQGFGAGEPTYESPEQALTIAEMWANNPELRAMSELFGRLDRDIRFQRSKRVIGGNDEIVDVEFGDNLRRVLPSELALLGDEDTEDDFLARYSAGELLVFSTVGEENAGRGPIVIVCDASSSMRGERNIWARAVAMCFLHIARLEKRDFAFIEFASANNIQCWEFPHAKKMAAQDVLDMASHFFGGGTSPIQGVARAAKLMEDAPPFKKADICIIGDGDGGFGPEDKRLRDLLIAKGVRLFGIAIGQSHFQYLTEYCEHVVNVADFELTDPSQATAELAVHVS